MQRIHLSKTEFLFRLAISDLVLLKTMLATVCLGLTFELVPFLGVTIGNLFGASEVAFYLADNRLQGFLTGAGFSFLVGAFLGAAWIPLFLGQIFISSGILALNFGWGIWVGLLPGLWLHFLVVGVDRQSRTWLWVKFGLNALLLILTIVFSDNLSFLIRSIEMAGVISTRDLQWYLSGVLTLIFSLGLAMSVFHIYFWLFRGKR